MQMATVQRVLFRVLALFMLAVAASCAAHTAPFEEQRTAVSADGSRIAYGVAGSAEPTIVFVHGWLGDHELWRRQVEEFSADHRVARLDLAGHGKSTTARTDFTMQAFAADVVAVCDAVHAQRIVLVGHSMGGPVAVEAAEKLGGRVAGIIAVDAFHTPLAAVPEERKLGFVKMLEADYPEALALTVESMFTKNAPPDVVRVMYEAMLGNDRTMGASALAHCIRWTARRAPEELPRYAGMLYNINAAPDGAGQAQRKDVVLITGAGHFIPMMRPGSFNAALRDILQEIEKRE